MNAAREGWIKGLPPYIGFGTLDPSSISESGGVLTATYKSREETVYEVRVGAERSEIVEYFEGRELSRSTHRTLGQAFLIHMMRLPMDDHPRLRKLFRQIAVGRNININFYVDQGLVTYPAGYLFSLRLPITSANRAAWEVFADRVEQAGEAAPLKLLTENEGYILKLTVDGDVLVEEVAIAHCSALLFNLEGALDFIWESGAVLPVKEHRLTVMPIEELALGRLVVYPGDKCRGFLTFSALPLTPAELKEYGIEDLFREVSLGLLASTSGGREVDE